MIFMDSRLLALLTGRKNNTNYSYPANDEH